MEARFSGVVGVFLLWTHHLVQCRIDKEKDLEGLITDPSIETHEIPLKYDLFRERVLPELLQTVDDEVMAEYVDKIPDVVSTVDHRHTTIVYRHGHLYYTVPDEMYRKLRYYKWKFRSRRRRTLSTPEPSYTINEKDIQQIRNQIGENDEGGSSGSGHRLEYTRNTLLVGEAHPPRELHKYIMRRHKLVSVVWGSGEPAVQRFIDRTFCTEYRTVRRLNRTVTFIPFHMGTWRTDYSSPLTTPYYLLPNFTLPTKRTLAPDWESYDDVVYPYVTDRAFPFPDEARNRRRFSLSIVERIKQHEAMESARTLDTSYLKYILQPYKYSTTPVPGLRPSTRATTTEPYFPGYQMYITTPPWTTPMPASSGEIIVCGDVEKREKVENMKMNLNDDAFDMDVAFDYPMVTQHVQTTFTSKVDQRPSEINTVNSVSVDLKSEGSSQNTQPASPCTKQVVTSRTGSSMDDTQTTNNEIMTSTRKKTNITDKISHRKSSSKRGLTKLKKRVNKSKVHHIEKRSLTAKVDFKKSELNSTKIKLTKILSNTSNEITTEQTYQKFRSMLLKKLSRKTVASKVTQKYTFKTRKILMQRKVLFRSKTSTSVYNNSTKIVGLKCKNRIVTTENEEEFSQQKSTQGDRLRSKMRTNATQKSQTRNGRHQKSTTQGYVKMENGLSSKKFSKECEDYLKTKRPQQNMNTRENCATSKKRTKKSKVERYEEILNRLYPPVLDEDEKFLNMENTPDITEKKTQKCSISDVHTTKKKRKRITKAKAERPKEILHGAYTPDTNGQQRDSIENQARDSSAANVERHRALQYDEQSDEKPKKKSRKTKAEKEVEFLNQMYPPVTMDEAWLREYESKLIPTLPQNMSRNEFIRGFYTFETPKSVPSTRINRYENSTSQNQAGYFQNDTNLFSSEEMVKFGEVINLYNKYVKEFLQESISTTKSRKKTTTLATQKIDTLMEHESINIVITCEYKRTRDSTRPYIACNCSNFIYY